MKTKLYAVFCGCGKSYLCKNFPEKYTEIDCWKYQQQQSDFPENYIREVKNQINKTEYLFISTDNRILNQLIKENINFTLVYPDESLKIEYMNRYCNRNDSYDFLGVMYKHWSDWLIELETLRYCKHIILKSNQYLIDVI